MKKVQFPKYESRQILGVVHAQDIEAAILPEPMRFDLMRWKNTFAKRCNEQLRSVQTEEGGFVEARLISEGEYMGMATQYGHNVMYHEDTYDGTIRLQTHLLEPTNFTPVSCVSRETTAIIERVDVTKPKDFIEDSIILHLMENGATSEELKFLYLSRPQWFTNESPARWHAMLQRGGNLEITSFYSNLITHLRDILSRTKIHGVYTEIIGMNS